MNTEAKFRAWDSKNKKFAFEGFHVIGEVTLFDLVKEYSLEETVNLEVTEWIRKQDKNGKDIYVGDIIEVLWKDHETTLETVSFDSEYGYYKYGNNPISELVESKIEFQVVGHIYED